MRKIIIAILLTLTLSLLAITPIILQKGTTRFLYAQECLENLSPSDYDTVKVYANVDGDTIKVIWKGGIEYVRLIGVDTPETVHPRKPVEYFGKAASLFTKLMLPPNEEIRLTYDWNPRDKYNRLLAYVWFKVKYQGKEYWILHNLALILNGFGHAYTVFYFRDDYRKIFLEAERFAREHNIGLWSYEVEKKVLEKLEKGEPFFEMSILEEKTEQKEEKTYNVNIVYIKATGRDEYIVIKNTGTEPVNLAGWKIFSEGGQWYTFPSVVLEPGESISVHSGPEASGALIWTRRYVWNNREDKAVLYNANGDVVDVYEY
ncbi:MAG TPA: hypothetical protein ENG66_01260 [Thermococcus sp.]|nr:hypothetical protein [Thermococcus sp.]